VDLEHEVVIKKAGNWHTYSIKKYTFKKVGARHWWLIPVILAIPEGEIRRIVF
jgi:hypothetical protein